MILILAAASIQAHTLDHFAVIYDIYCTTAENLLVGWPKSLTMGTYARISTLGGTYYSLALYLFYYSFLSLCVIGEKQ